MNQDGLSERLVIDKGTTAKAVKELESDGFILREADPTDKRTNRLYPTQKGEELKEELDLFLVEWRDVLWKGFSEGEKTQAYYLVEKMAENAKDYFSQKRKTGACIPK